MNGMEKSNGWFLQILIKLYLNLIKTFSPQKSLNSLKILAIKIAKVFKFWNEGLCELSTDQVYFKFCCSRFPIIFG